MKLPLRIPQITCVNVFFSEPGPWCYNAEGTEPRYELCEIPKCGKHIVEYSNLVFLANSIALFPIFIKLEFIFCERFSTQSIHLADFETQIHTNQQ